MQQDFLKILTDMVESVEGGSAATIMGMDGISIQNYKAAEAAVDIESLAIEYGRVMLDVRRTTDILNLGALEEVVITSNTNKVLLRFIGRDYFAAFVLTPDGNLGKARYFLRKASEAAGGELK